LTDGQALAPPLDYAPLPASMASSVQARLKTIDIAGAK
jgi:hypothetical protein